MAGIAGFSFGYVLDTLLVPGDAQATFDNLQASEQLFRFGILGWLVILICDVLAAWGLYVYLQATHPSLSLLTAWFRLTYVALLGVALLSQIQVLPLLQGSEFFANGESAYLQNQALLLMEGFTSMWSLGLIVFGAHLLGLGYLAYQASDIPKVLGILILLAGLGYLLVHGGSLLAPQAAVFHSILETIFLLPMIAGELGLGIWLLWKGGKKPTH
jgi:hypothetical protein